MRRQDTRCYVVTGDRQRRRHRVVEQYMAGADPRYRKVQVHQPIVGAAHVDQERLIALTIAVDTEDTSIRDWPRDVEDGQARRGRRDGIVSINGIVDSGPVSRPARVVVRQGGQRGGGGCKVYGMIILARTPVPAEGYLGQRFRRPVHGVAEDRAPGKGQGAADRQDISKRGSRRESCPDGIIGEGGVPPDSQESLGVGAGLGRIAQNERIIKTRWTEWRGCTGCGLWRKKALSYAMRGSLVT